MKNTGDYFWKKRLPRQSREQSPFVPSLMDLGYIAGLIADWQAANTDTAREITPTALILGVTRGYALLPWPDGFDVIGLDKSPQMIEQTWPCHGQAMRHVVCGNWLQTPLPEAAADIILCDGGIALLGYPDEQQAFLREIGRVLRPGGLLILRCFLQGQNKQDPDDLFRQFEVGALDNALEFKFRLTFAVQDTPEEGVRIGKPLDVWTARQPDLATLAAKRNWPAGVLETVNVSRGSNLVSHFATLAELRQLAEGILQEVDCHTLDYPAGEHCPIISFRKPDTIR